MRENTHTLVTTHCIKKERKIIATMKTHTHTHIYRLPPEFPARAKPSFEACKALIKAGARIEREARNYENSWREES